jgi:YVTN family beta-propeller protein
LIVAKRGESLRAWKFALCVALLVASTKPACAQIVVLKNLDANVVAVVKTGKSPAAVVVNPVTNKIYVANSETFDVTAIDGETNAPARVKVGFDPRAIAVNAVTNKIYVACGGDKNVWIIDGATNATTKVVTGKSVGAIAVNPVTNKIYTVVEGNKVTVIDGATTATAEVATGKSPFDIAVNSVTNKVYVANGASDDITVIDGATNKTTVIALVLGSGPLSVNSVTNKIYVAHRSNYNYLDAFTGCFWHGKTNCGTRDGGVTAIDGATNQIITVPTSESVVAVEVNSVTNTIYLAESGFGTSESVSVIEGATNKGSFLVVQGAPGDEVMAVNPVTNKIYITYSGFLKDDYHFASGSMVVIDGATQKTTVTTFDPKVQPAGVAVNPATNRIYVTNRDVNTVTVFDGGSSDTARLRQ